MSIYQKGKKMDPLKIVIVDDEMPHLVLMRRSILREIPGAIVECHTDPVSCLELIWKNRPDLVITDYLMPEMDGIELIRRIKEKDMDIPIIMITGHGDEYVAVSAMKMGAMEYLVKSADVFDLLPGVIKRVLREKELRNRLEETTKRFQDIMERTFNWIWETDSEGYYIYSNPAVKDIIGYAPKELQDKHYYDLFPDENKKTLINKILHISNNTPLLLEHPFVHKNGDKIIVESNIFPMFDANGRFKGYRGISRDVTERRKAERALKESEKQKKLILDSSLDWIRYVDRDMRIIWANKAIRSHLKMPQKEIQGQVCHKLLLNRDAPCEGCPVVKARISGKVERAIMKKPPFRAMEKETYWDIYCVPLKDKTGNITSFVEVARNITEQREAETRIRHLTQQLIRAHEEERKLISLELHDRIAQDLSILKIGLDTLNYEHKEMSTKIIKKIEELSKIVQQTITNVKNMAYDLRPPELDQLGVIKTIFHFCKDISERHHLNLSFSTAGTENIRLDPETEINTYRFVQEAFNNIARHAEAKNVVVKIIASYPKIIIRIKDDGKGFNVENEMKKQVEGKKMGLRSMQERASLIGGRLIIKSSIGKGTNLTLEVPYK